MSSGPRATRVPPEWGGPAARCQPVRAAVLAVISLSLSAATAAAEPVALGEERADSDARARVAIGGGFELSYSRGRVRVHRGGRSATLPGPIDRRVGWF